ncbi:MAG: error-prone DNA polymerase [Planctomycetota bacterium]
MPDEPPPKPRPHPAKLPALAEASARGARGAPAEAPYAELSVTSNFTFLTGASHPEELVERAAALGYRAVGITDTNTLAGVVRAHVAAEQVGMRLIVGCRLALRGGLGLLVYPTDRASYSRLCRVLTLGKRRAPKGECDLSLHDVIEHADGLLGVVEPPAVIDDGFVQTLGGLRSVFDEDRLSVAAAFAYGQDDRDAIRRIGDLAEHAGVPMVATNAVLYHAAGRRPLQDILTCIRLGCTIDEAGLRLRPNAERHLKPPDEMARLFAASPDAVRRSVEIAERASGFGLDQLRYEYPTEPCPPGLSPRDYLEREALRGARDRYDGEIPASVRRSFEHELALINELEYEAYFLTCYDIVSFARSRGILCQGRGGAANSAVCYCLGITEVDPATHSLLFERFISRERNEPPDIDIDFEHERREEVLQYIYDKYGRERAAMTAEVISYRGRSAVREVAKAMGLSQDAIDTLAKSLDRWGESATDERVLEAGLDPRDPTIRRIIDLSGELVGFPRHLSQHVGGMVVTRGRLCDLVPIENAAMDDRTVIEWDKDDIDAMGMLKIDCLGLGMLTCIRKAFGLLDELGVHGPHGQPMTIADVMALERDDDEVYEMISRADTVGVFQIESRAQMSMLPRLKPRCFYDLVIEVAIVRPGPIQGGMVHPYLRRREGTEPVEYPDDAVRDVLERTLGVPLFQEQAMQLAITAAGFSPDEADGLRRSMAAWKRKGNAIYRYGQQLIDGMLERGYDRDFAERCFEQIKGFSEYGFPESHAASFAILVYVSCWLKKHHPAAFAAALINSQPMGFYAPAQIIRDAQDHGIEALPIDVNRSRWDCTIDASGRAIRLGTRLVKGLPIADAEAIADAVDDHGAFETIEKLWKTSGVSVRSLRSLARADAFGSMGLDRQRAIWQIGPLRDAPMPLFEQADTTSDAGLDRLPERPADAQTIDDYLATGLSLKTHPVAFVREELQGMGAVPAGELRSGRRCPQGRQVAVAGLVLCRQRPGTASGVTFITIEDETGIANLIIWRDVFERHRRVGRLSTLLLARGTVERQGEVVHMHVRSMQSMDDRLPSIAVASRNFH